MPAASRIAGNCGGSRHRRALRQRQLHSRLRQRQRRRHARPDRRHVQRAHAKNRGRAIAETAGTDRVLQDRHHAGQPDPLDAGGILTFLPVGIEGGAPTGEYVDLAPSTSRQTASRRICHRFCLTPPYTARSSAKSPSRVAAATTPALQHHELPVERHRPREQRSSPAHPQQAGARCNWPLRRRGSSAWRGGDLAGTRSVQRPWARLPSDVSFRAELGEPAPRSFSARAATSGRAGPPVPSRTLGRRGPGRVRRGGCAHPLQAKSKVRNWTV